MRCSINYLSVHRNGDPAKLKSVVAAWWQELHAKGERQLLVEGVLRGDPNSAAQTRALLEKFPNGAVPVIVQGIKNQLYQNERPRLFHAVTDRYPAGKDLPPEVRDFCRTLLNDTFGSQFGGKTYAPDVPGNLHMHALNVLCQHGDAQATRLLLADWERRRQEFTGPMFAENNEAIPAMLRCKDGAALPALTKGWAQYPQPVRVTVVYAVRRMLAEPGYAITATDHRRKLGDLLIQILSDHEEFKGPRSRHEGKLNFPYERLCDFAAEVPIPGMERPLAFNPEAPRAVRDDVIAQLQARWRAYSRAMPAPAGADR